MDAIDQERQRIIDERKAREAEKALEMLRPIVRCTRPNTNCREVSIKDRGSVNYCQNCSTGDLECSACSKLWGGEDVCRNCKQAFR